MAKYFHQMTPIVLKKVIRKSKFDPKLEAEPEFVEMKSEKREA